MHTCIHKYKHVFFFPLRDSNMVKVVEVAAKVGGVFD